MEKNKASAQVGQQIEEWDIRLEDMPFTRIEGLESITTLKSKWDDRPRSNIIKWLMDKSSRSLEEIAKGLGRSVGYLNNKIHRGSFSIDELIIVAYICGYTVTLTSNDPDEEEHTSYQIDVREYFGGYDEDVLRRLHSYEMSLKERKRAEYEDLKAQLEKMKTEYGFED